LLSARNLVVQWALDLAAVAAVLVAFGVIIATNIPPGPGDRLLNVSYDPTRELYVKASTLSSSRTYEKRTGQHLTIVQSHGGSSRQARAVITAKSRPMS
jgi:ABC-type sulfate transport system substrate-binding protein